MIKTKIKKQKTACGSSDNNYLHSLSGKNGQKKKSGNGKLDDNEKTTTTTKLSSSHRQHIFPVLQKQKQKLNCPFRSVAVADNTVACVFHFFCTQLASAAYIFYLSNSYLLNSKHPHLVLLLPLFSVFSIDPFNCLDQLSPVDFDLLQFFCLL